MFPIETRQIVDKDDPEDSEANNERSKSLTTMYVRRDTIKLRDGRYRVTTVWRKLC